MAQLIIGNNVRFLMNELDVSDLIDGDYTQQTPTSVRLDLGEGFTVQFTGVNFVFDALGDVAGGTITGIEDRYNGNIYFALTGANISATQFAGWAFSHNTTAALTSIFAGDDVMTGNVFDEYLNGYAGHDNMFGGAGGDTLIGGDGNDHLYGQSANGGNDAGDSLSGGSGNDYLQGNAGNDTLDGGEGSDRLNGGNNDDIIVGGAGNDTVNGNIGNDSIDGGADNDSLRGGQGNDSIAGGSGNDILSGDLGADTLSGGTGVDVFQFSGQGSTLAAPDRITDFADGTDRLSIGFAPAAVLTGSAQFSVTDAANLAQQLFNANAGDREVAAIAVGGDTYIFYSSSGGGTVDSAVQLVGVSASAIGTADFL